MGIKYSSSDSQNLMQAMKNNIELANQITDRLASGCDHLLSSLDSGQLKGAAYTAGRELFSEVIIPAIKKLQEAVDDIQTELKSYEYADSTISEYGTLDMDNLKEQLKIKKEQLSKIEEEIAENANFLAQAQALFTGRLEAHLSKGNALGELKIHVERHIRELETKIEKLTWFVNDVSRYFTDSLQVLNLAVQGALALSNISLDEEGHYYTNGTNMDWLTQLRGSEIKTHDRGNDPKLSLIKENSRNLMLSDEAAVYYQKELLALLDGKPAKDWPLLIEAYNQALMFDYEGNIITVAPVDFSNGQVHLVYKNGEYDQDYTVRLMQEQNAQFLESLGENALQILAGLAQVISGAMIGIGSTGVEAGGLVLGLPTGGTAVIPATAVASAGFATSATLTATGTATLNDALSKIAAANAQLQISFAKGHDDWKASKPTSKTFGRPVEGRVGGRKSKIRVDAEPDSNSIHIQTGGGKSSPLKRHIRLSEITDKDSIYQALKKLKNPAVKSLSKGKLDELVNNIWRAFQWLKS
ncbi:virulence protein [Streptococcus oricebi]|uniref:Virulence protein n=1 Tax=Streptococcus oricebi TaxID=1547447 RepID=A0ABS5B3F0_9STRE|nr:virulence protein [Streptococcus oricebi]MBP2622983.1 virulence protein [Streptococcus oricebi]